MRPGRPKKTPLLRVAESAFESYSIRIRLELIFMDAHYTSHFRYLAYKLTDAIFYRSLAVQLQRSAFSWSL